MEDISMALTSFVSCVRFCLVRIHHQAIPPHSSPALLQAVQPVEVVRRVEELRALAQMD